MNSFVAGDSLPVESEFPDEDSIDSSSVDDEQSTAVSHLSGVKEKINIPPVVRFFWFFKFFFAAHACRCPGAVSQRSVDGVSVVWDHPVQRFLAFVGWWPFPLVLVLVCVCALDRCIHRCHLLACNALLHSHTMLARTVAQPLRRDNNVRCTGHWQLL